MKGIRLDSDNGLEIQVGRDASGKIAGGLVIGERKVQDAYLVLKANQGDFKEDPVIGANLFLNVRRKQDRKAMGKAITVSLARVGINLDDIRGEFQAIINGENINI